MCQALVMQLIHIIIQLNVHVVATDYIFQMQILAFRKLRHIGNLFSVFAYMTFLKFWGMEWKKREFLIFLVSQNSA